jgi:hypothetical protein
MRSRPLAGPLIGLLVLAAACTATGGHGPRWAYLQQGTADGVVVAWRSEDPTVGRVAWGTAPAALDRAVTEEHATRDHALRLQGLPPGARIYYGWADDDAPLATGPNQYYDTPPPGADGRVTFWVLGDSGNGSADQRAVGDAIRAFPGTADADFLLHVGDIAYDDGTTREFDHRFFDAYGDLLPHLVVWPAPGNHDERSADSGTGRGPYFDAFVLPAHGECGGVPSGTEAYYSFDHGPLHVVVLDTAGSRVAPGSPMLEWLDRDLAANALPWTIAVFHHPPYTHGTHDSDTEQPSIRVRENLVPILEAHGVDVVFSGHSHTYERSALVSGAYDTPTTATGHVLATQSPYVKTPGPYGGTVYVVAGHGGAKSGGPLDHPLVVVGSHAHGAVFVELQGDELHLQDVRADGTIGDDLRLLRPPAAPQP